MRSFCAALKRKEDVNQAGAHASRAQKGKQRVASYSRQLGFFDLFFISI